MKECLYLSGIRCLKFNSKTSIKYCRICKSYIRVFDAREVGESMRDILNKINKKQMEDKSMKLTIKNLENCFNKAWDEGFMYVGIKVAMDGFTKEEVIINSHENFGEKLNYYKNAYNEDLTLKNAPDKVKIIGFTYATSFSQIEKDLLGVSNNNSITIDCKLNITEEDIKKIAEEAQQKLIESLQRNARCTVR